MFSSNTKRSYPRWINGPGLVRPVTLDERISSKFPAVPFTPHTKDDVDILIPGCGTGMTTGVVQGYRNARILSVDLSLSSLCLFQAQDAAAGAGGSRVEYAQGDILKLGEINRTFDLIEVTGVLHHMRDPFEGWRVLLTLLRPGGFMHLAFYSEIARHDVVAARAFIAERGYTTISCRIFTPLPTGLAKYTNGKPHPFPPTFSRPARCRDLLFHVQESRMTIIRTSRNLLANTD